MKLCGLLNELDVVMEGYGRTNQFDYENWHVDPTPNILKLGTWVHPNTGNTLVAGINLNYLTPQQVLQVREFLPSILKNRHLKLRYWKGMELLPDIFDNFYRTYDRKYINIVEPGTLRFLSPQEVQKMGKQKEDEKLAQRKAQITQKKGQLAKAKSLEKDIVQTDLAEPPETDADKGREAVKAQQAQRNIRAVPPRPEEVPLEGPPAPEVPQVPIEAPPEEKIPEAPPPEAAPAPAEAPEARIMPKAPALRRKATPEAPEPSSGSGPQPNRPGEAPEREPGAPIPSRKPEEPEEEGIVELPPEEE